MSFWMPKGFMLTSASFVGGVGARGEVGSWAQTLDGAALETHRVVVKTNIGPISA